MRLPTADLRISTARPLLSPAILEEDLPLPEAGAALVQAARRTIGDILAGRDDRLIAVVVPCSIHDPAAALDYAKKLKPVADRLARDLPVLTWKLPSRCGSLIRPFQPTVVRGFSK